MPEYLAPGVYVEETSFRSKSIEGVGTSTTAFVGPTQTGPVSGSPELLTSVADFERIYGGVEDLSFGPNYLAHAVRAYYSNGGSRLYVSRIVSGTTDLAETPTTANPPVQFVARFVGRLLNGASLSVSETTTPVRKPGLDAAPAGSVARVGPAATAVLWIKTGAQWQRRGAGNALEPVPPADIVAVTEAALILLSVGLRASNGQEWRYEGLGVGAEHPQFIGSVLAATPSKRSDAQTLPIRLVIGGTPREADALLPELTAVFAPLSGGLDGALPGAAAYEAGLRTLAALEDISIVAAPGYSANADANARDAIQGKLIGHAESRRSYRIAVLDAPRDQTPSTMRDERGKIDSKYAALYYPWVTVSNPLAGPENNAPREINLPPSGFVCGIYARNDVERGVHKAPANEIVRDALRFERDVNFAEQELLNPIGVNCLRYLSGRGYRIWGARTVSSDPEWKYVNVRRYFNYLEASIDRGTQWAVFEGNGELLWANVRGTIGDFLYNEWKNGALLGTKPEQAFFVRCDRTTMTQNDLDNGRLVCLVGVAVIKPAEFVIFRIGQKTADA